MKILGGGRADELDKQVQSVNIVVFSPSLVSTLKPLQPAWQGLRGFSVARFDYNRA